MGPSNTESNQKSSTTELASRYGENDVPGSRFPELKHSNHELPLSMVPPADTGDTTEFSLKNQSTTDSPPVQVMERPGDSKYRIPSSVFARTKSTTPMEWSVASNESLFSIHMGNMSFSKDPMFWRSGELGMSGEAFPSGQFFNYPPNNPPIDEATNNGKTSEGSVEAAVDTMKEVIRESSEDQSSKKSPLAPSISHRSDDSVKSFAFPILSGDIDKGVSVKMGGSVRLAPENQHSRQQQQQPPQTPPQPEPTTSSATPDKPQTKWFHCLSCCSCCC